MSELIAEQNRKKFTNHLSKNNPRYFSSLEFFCEEQVCVLPKITWKAIYQIFKLPNLFVIFLQYSSRQYWMGSIYFLSFIALSMPSISTATSRREKSISEKILEYAAIQTWGSW